MYNTSQYILPRACSHHKTDVEATILNGLVKSSTLVPFLYRHANTMIRHDPKVRITF